MKKMFKIGDRVRVIKGYFFANKGYEGIIKALPENNGAGNRKTFGECYSVEIPAFDGGHSCGGTVPSGHGMWLVPGCLELIKSAPVEKIVITHDGKTTLARLYEGNKVVKSAEAKCDPRDEFIFKEGAELAFERLTGEEKKEEPPKFDKSMLTNLRFGYKTEAGWFVVTGDRLVYQSGEFDWMSMVREDGSFLSGKQIKYIVDAFSFKDAKFAPRKVIWCAPDFDPKKVN